MTMQEILANNTRLWNENMNVLANVARTPAQFEDDTLSSEERCIINFIDLLNKEYRELLSQLN